MKRITEEECEKLYQEYGTPDHVIAHCRAVSHVAVTIAERLNASGFSLDLDLIRGAGLAHDVARVCEKHWEIGADILAERGYKDEAAIVRVHMTYNFHAFPNLDETDLVCLGDRLVIEGHYAGLEKRFDYIVNKAPHDENIRRHLEEKRKENRMLLQQIETVIGQTIDSLFLE